MCSDTGSRLLGFAQAGRNHLRKNIGGHVAAAYAVKDAGKDIGKGSEKGTKVIVYSSEDAGKKVAHFFEKM
jgi:hypothetical protein